MLLAKIRSSINRFKRGITLLLIIFVFKRIRTIDLFSFLVRRLTLVMDNLLYISDGESDSCAIKRHCGNINP